MNTRIHSLVAMLVLAAAAIFSLSIAVAQQQPKTGEHDMAGMKQDEMNKRGDKVMGFDHTKTTHHFGLLRNGGTIEVVANQAADTASRDEIRKHLTHIAMMFAEGNFKAPILIHDQNPPGVAVMQRLKGEIEYKFEESELGGRVRISTSNPEALNAIHDFLRFQIKEHKTGDPLEVGQIQ